MFSGHCTYSWDMVLEYGLIGLKDKVDNDAKQSENKEKRIFLTALGEIYQAIIDYVLRYKQVAIEAGMCELADNLNTVATKKPDTFTSALQLLWIITLIDCAYIAENPTLTLGRMDQLLYPYYHADIENGILTKEKAKRYIVDYYAKHNLIMGRGEHQIGDATNSTTFHRIYNFDAPQYLLLAGRDKQGEVCINELTQLFSECIVPSFKNPVVVVRYVKGIHRRLTAIL